MNEEGAADGATSTTIANCDSNAARSISKPLDSYAVDKFIARKG